MRSKQKVRLDSHYVFVNILDFFGCGSKIYSSSNIAKNSLEFQKLSDFFDLKFKLNVYPIAPLPYGLMTYIHALFVKKGLYIPQ